ncbi:MAG TPA: glycosyl hydrolase family 28 protein, partial [Bacillota bacterium]|nr:glycosyl hydrolase family 28 protein [Bacillota bacterium]
TYDIHNADGVDLATTDTAYIFNSTFDTGDDCINFNAGCGATGVSENYPDQNIRVFNCTCKRGHGAVVFGSFTAAWIKNVNVEDCAFDGTDIGLRFKTGNDQGGGADNVYARDLTIKNIQDQALFWDSSYDSAYSGGGKGQFKNIYVDNVTVTTSKSEGIYIHGQSGMPHNNINISNVTLSGTGGASLDYCINSTFSNITFVSGSSSTWSISNSSGLSFVNCNPRPAGYSNSTPTPTRTNTPTPTSRQGSTPTRRVAGTAIPTRTTSPTAMVTPTPTARPVTPTPTSRRTSTATPTRRAVVTATPNNRAGTPTSRLSSTPTSTPPSGTTLFSDNFESGNANNWTATTGTWSVVQDSGSYVYYQSSANEGRTSAGSSSWTNYAVEAKVKVDNFNGANRAYVCGRYRDGNNFYCASLYNSSGGTLEIRKKVAGSTTNLVTKTNVGLVAGTWYTVKLVLKGSNISVYLNGTQVLTATDSSLTSGAVGLIAYKVVAKYDDVVVSGL